MIRNNALGSFSFDVIARILDVLNQHGRSIKKTNLASKTGLNYNVCLRYILLLGSLGWIEVNSELSITQTGKGVFANLLDLADAIASSSRDNIWLSNLGEKTAAYIGSSYILSSSFSSSVIQTNPPLPPPSPPSSVTEKQVVSQSEQKTSNKKNKNKTIMIVDDERDVAQTYEYFLSSAGYEARTFSDPRLALREYVSNPFLYDLLVLDIRMQHINGLQLYQSIKAVNPECRAIFASCLEIAREAVSILPGIRPQDIMHKPVSKEQFLTAVKSVLI